MGRYVAKELVRRLVGDIPWLLPRQLCYRTLDAGAQVLEQVGHEEHMIALHGSGETYLIVVGLVAFQRLKGATVSGSAYVGADPAYEARSMGHGIQKS